MMAPGCIREIKHDGVRMMVRRDAAGVRLLTRNGRDWADRYPLIAEAAGAPGVRSCLIDEEAVACDRDGMPATLPPAGRRRVPVRVRPDRTQRPGPSARANRDSETRAGQAAAFVCPDWPPPQRAHRRAGRRRVPPRLQARAGGHRLEAARLPLPLGATTRLAQIQKPSGAGGKARGRRRLGRQAVAVKPDAAETFWQRFWATYQFRRNFGRESW